MARLLSRGYRLQAIENFDERFAAVMLDLVADLNLPSSQIELVDGKSVHAQLRRVLGLTSRIGETNRKNLAEALCAVNLTAKILCRLIHVPEGCSDLRDHEFRAYQELLDALGGDSGRGTLGVEELEHLVGQLDTIGHAAARAALKISPLAEIHLDGLRGVRKRSRHRRGDPEVSRLGGARPKTEWREMLFQACWTVCGQLELKPTLSRTPIEGQFKYGGNLFKICKYLEKLLPSELRYRSDATRYKNLSQYRDELNAKRQHTQKPSRGDG